MTDENGRSPKISRKLREEFDGLQPIAPITYRKPGKPRPEPKCWTEPAARRSDRSRKASLARWAKWRAKLGEKVLQYQTAKTHEETAPER